MRRTFPVEHVWASVERGNGCWHWPGRVAHTGYGVCFFRGTQILAHRYAWELASGSPPPRGFDVLHTCDTRDCVRNDDVGTYEVDGRNLPRFGHLALGTRMDNVRDAMQKGRVATGDRAGARTHPARRAFGDRSGSRRHPERLARGDRHGTHTHPESIVRGEAVNNAKLTNASVVAIRTRRALGEPVYILMRDYGVSRKTVQNVVSGKSWRHVLS